MHYLVGIAFAAVLAALTGDDWLHAPTPGPALAFGLATVAAPLLVMQPAIGAGLAASGTPAPWTQRLRSTADHAVFGLGLYLAARVLHSTSCPTPCQENLDVSPVLRTRPLRPGPLGRMSLLVSGISTLGFLGL